MDIVDEPYLVNVPDDNDVECLHVIQDEDRHLKLTSQQVACLALNPTDVYAAAAAAVPDNLPIQNELREVFENRTPACHDVLRQLAVQKGVDFGVVEELAEVVQTTNKVVMAAYSAARVDSPGSSPTNSCCCPISSPSDTPSDDEVGPSTATLMYSEALDAQPDNASNLPSPREEIDFDEVVAQRHNASATRVWESVLCIGFMERYHEFPAMKETVRLISASVVDLLRLNADNTSAIEDVLEALKKDNFSFAERGKSIDSLEDMISVLEENKHIFSILEVHCEVARVGLREFQSVVVNESSPLLLGTLEGRRSYMDTWREVVRIGRGRIKCYDHKGLHHQLGIMLPTHSIDESLIGYMKHAWGHDTFHTNPSADSEYVIDSMISKSVPYVSGCSGKVSMMQPLAMYIGSDEQERTPVQLSLYLALTAFWMVANSNHSLYEAFKTAKDLFEDFGFDAPNLGNCIDTVAKLAPESADLVDSIRQFAFSEVVAHAQPNIPTSRGVSMRPRMLDEVPSPGSPSFEQATTATMTTVKCDKTAKRSQFDTEGWKWMAEL